MIEVLHFLRPLWLLALPAIVLIWWLVRRRDSNRADVGTFVAPHLREALTINRDARKGIRAVDGVALAMVFVSVAASGPTWSKQASPWFAETAPLVIAMEVTDSMRSNDLQPTRLDRARFKVLDLIAARTGSRTAIVAYSGTSHIVVPPSTDLDVIKPLLESLDPAIMPVPGARAESVLESATALLGDDAAIGTLLFVNDGFDALDVPVLTEFASRPDAPAVVSLVIGTDEGGVALLPDGSPVMSERGGRIDTRIDTSVLRRVSSEAGVPVIRMTSSDDDVRHLVRVIESNLAQADDPNAQWRDEGWWLLWPALLFALIWFRRGWTMRW